MNREEFLKVLGTFAGGAILASCDRELIGEIVPAGTSDVSLDIELSKQWFNNVFLAQQNEHRSTAEFKPYKRKANWDKAEKQKNSSKNEYIWVPIEYEDNDNPLLLTWDDKTIYRKKLEKFYQYPIVEGLIVYKEKNENRAVLSQFAYDPYSIMRQNFVLKRSNFTGLMFNINLG